MDRAVHVNARSEDKKLNKRGAVLIFATLAVVFLSGLLGAFFMQTVGETILEHRQADSISALWLAEAGIAKVKSQPVLGPTTGSIPNTSFPHNTYTFTVAAPEFIGGGCYTLVSTGTVTTPGSVVARTVSVTIHVVPPDASKIGYSVETTSEALNFKAKCLINNEDPSKIFKTMSDKTFQSFFGMDMAEMRAKADLQLQGNAIGNTISAVPRLVSPSPKWNP